MTSLLNNWFMALIEFLAICEITPSCWNHVFSLTCGNWVNSFVKKSCGHSGLMLLLLRFHYYPRKNTGQ
jgi:hypothetical protein